MDKISGIYKITSPTNRIYIGQSIDIQKRIWRYMSNHGAKTQYKLHNSLKKYGWDAHKFEIIEECSIDLLNERERFWQEFYDVLGKNGLNCILTSTRDKKFICSEETRKKYSEAKKGKSFTKEHKEKLSNSKKGKKLSESHKKSISKSHQGYKFSEESKQKMSNSKKKSGFLKEHINVLSQMKKKPIICKEDNLIFNSISEACKYYNISNSSMSNHLKGKSKQLKIKKSFKYV